MQSRALNAVRRSFHRGRVAFATLQSTAVPTYRCKSTVVAKIHQPINNAKNSTANLVKRHYMSRGSDSWSPWNYDSDSDAEFDPNDEHDNKSNWKFRQNQLSIEFDNSSGNTIKAVKEYEKWQQENKPTRKTVIYMITKLTENKQAELAFSYLTELAYNYQVEKQLLKKIMAALRLVCLDYYYPEIQQQLDKLAQLNNIKLGKFRKEIKESREVGEVGGLNPRNNDVKHIVSTINQRIQKIQNK